MNKKFEFEGDHQPKQHPPEFSELDEIDKMLIEAEIDLSKEPPPPPVILSIDDTPLFFLGDFSMTIGKAKSRKTFWGTMIMATLVGNLSNGRLKATLPDDKRAVLFFDTEQGKYHAFKAAKRIHRQLKTEETPHFKAFSLRKFDCEQRLDMINRKIHKTPNLGVVFIDGVRDLISSINDEEQATMVTSKLMKWSEELNIHINCVLHMNKGDQNARGHIGTEMLNKALSIIAVTKDKLNEQCSTIEVTDSREKQPEVIMMGIDETGLPYILDESELLSLKNETNTKKSIQPGDFSNDLHIETLKAKVFHIEKQLKYNQLLSSLQNAYSIGKNKAQNFVTHLKNESIISCEGKGNTTLYSMV